MFIYNYLVNTLTAVIAYSVMGVAVAWWMGEFKHKSFNSSMYWMEYWASMRIMAVTGVVGAITNELAPLALYSHPLEHGTLYLVKSAIIYTFLFDCLNFWTHRLLHTKWLYRNFHAYHHMFRPVMTMSAAAISVVDTLIIGQIPIWGPLVLLKYFGSGMWTGSFYGLTILITIYSIYLHALIGHKIEGGIIVDNADHLKHHHLTQCNYGNLFRIWDWICGTYV